MKEKANGTLSLWQEQRPLRKFQTLEKDLETEVCVIGAGISGLSTAFHLGESSKKVVVLEDGPVAGGQTVRTTGHLSNALDDRYFNLESYFGVEGSKLAAKAHTYAIEFAAQFAQKHKVNCELEFLDAYLFAAPGDSPETLDKELRAAWRAGLKEVEKLGRAPLEFFDTGPCLRFPNQAEFSPLPFIEALCDQIQAQGNSIYTSIHASQIEEEEGMYRVETEQGPKVWAKHVVMATNSPFSHSLFVHFKQAAYRTYVIAGKIPKGTIKKGLYYDTLDPYHYIRTARADADHDLLIVGGEDHRIGQEKEPKRRFERLEKWTRDRFPELEEIAHYWSGEILEPVDGLGMIGRVKKGAELYLITGDSGNGLTNGIFAGHLIDDLIHQRKSPWEKLFDPGRKTWRAASDLIEENSNTLWQYRDWITPGDRKSASHLPKNSGSIIRSGLKKWAFFRDAKGDLYKMSATCPHKKAQVRWNESEHCWECPAHGSCFSATGKVVQGPANKDLSEEG